jgi:hypothetical protein
LSFFDFLLFFAISASSPRTFVVRRHGDGMTLAAERVFQKRIAKRVAVRAKHSPQWKTMWTVAAASMSLVQTGLQTTIESSLLAA